MEVELGDGGGVREVEVELGGGGGVRGWRWS